MKTKPMLSLASGVMPEFTPQQTARAAIEAGFDAVGVWIDMALWTSQTTREMCAILADGALPVLDVEVLWIQPGAANPDHARALDIGAELGARNALAVSSDPDHGAAMDKFAQLCAYGEKLGLRVALEIFGYTCVRDLDCALAYLNHAASPAAALLIDPLHTARLGILPRDIAHLDPHLFSYAQFCDAAAAGPGLEDLPALLSEAVDGRLHLGDGGLPLREWSAALPSGTPLSIEMRSKALRDAYPDAPARATALLEKSRAFFDRS